MPHSTTSSAGSAPCRLEWHPSRLLASTLLGLAVLGAASVLACEMPRALARPASALVLAYGCWLARREWRRPRLAFTIRGGCRDAWVDGVAVQGVEVRWRGALAIVSWRDPAGRIQRRAWWPDVLPAPARRELRLATCSGEAAQPVASVAP